MKTVEIIHYLRLNGLWARTCSLVDTHSRAKWILDYGRSTYYYSKNSTSSDIWI